MAALQLEDVSCPVCGSNANTVRYRLRDLAYNVPGEFSVVMCDTCGHLYLSPRPTADSLDACYPADYQPFRRAIEDETGNFWLRRLRHRQQRTRCDQITRLLAGGRLLDVGCATGLFLNEMRAQGGWTVAGIEPNREAADYARSRFGLEVFNGPIGAAPWPERAFDVITLWDVVEHLPDPANAMRKLRKLLADDGYLVMGTPDPGSLDAALFGPDWVGWDPPRHLSVFSRAALSRLASEAGFRTERVYSFYGRYTTFALSLRLWLRRRLPPGRALQGLERLVMLPVWRYLTLPYFATVDRRGRGAIAVTIARPAR